MPTNYSLIENVKVNKIAKADYDLYVATGIITAEMIANEVWIFTDDNFLSAENLAKLEAFLPADYYKKTEADAKFLTDYTETDPTVPAWAKAATKPSYTASEVGALPASTAIPTALSALSDDANHRTVTDAEKEAWNGKAETRIWNPAE